MPRELFKKAKKERISEQTRRVLEVICEKWPANPLEVAKELGENGKSKSLSAKYLYQFRRLKEMDLIHMKKTGNTYIAWPIDMEKLRMIHELLRD
jgi:hypothetical protein